MLDEGCERELVSKIQNMRKEAGFEVTDRISILYTADGLAESISPAQPTPDKGFTREQSVNGDKVTLTLIKK